MEIESYVKIGSIFTIENVLIAKIVGKLDKKKINEIKMRLDELFDVR